MSIEFDFYFNMPNKYSDAELFVEHLKKDLGIHLSKLNEGGVWIGIFLGMKLVFDPCHDLENDGEVLFENYSSSIGITGYAGAGRLRIIQLQQVINIALAICLLNQIQGVIIKNVQTKVIHFGYNKKKNCLWDYDLQKEIIEYEIFDRCNEFGAKFRNT